MSQTNKTYDWKALVAAIDPERAKRVKQETAYEFSNGRKFTRPADPYKRQRGE